jgi:sugar/nucleoside kinase (ribokinase family)
LWGVDACVISRDGRNGCQVATGAEVRKIPAPVVNAIDTTGAGDAHTGALLAALHEGRGMMEAIVRANAAAAFSVARSGSATGPTSEELANFMGS